MSRKGVTSGHRSKNIPRIFQRRRSTSAGHNRTTAVRPVQQRTIIPTSVLSLQDNLPIIVSEENNYKRWKCDKAEGVASEFQVTNGCSRLGASSGEGQGGQVGDAETVANIEKWLKTRTESVSSMDLDVIKSEVGEDERYLGDELPHSFLGKDPDVLSMDIDLSDKKPYPEYDPLLQELRSDKLLEACEKDEFILPSFQLDPLDSLTLPPDVMMVAGEVLPSTGIQSALIPPLDSNSRRKIKDDKSKDQDSLDKCTRIKRTNAGKHNGTIGTSTDAATNDSSKGVTNVYVEAGGPVVIDTNVEEGSELDDDPLGESMIDQSPRFQPRIMKRHESVLFSGKKSNNEAGKQDGIMAMVAISTDKVSNLTQIVINTGKEEQIFQGKTTELIEATGNFPKLPKKKTASSWNNSNDYDRILSDRNDLIISNALMELGITDETLQPVLNSETGKVWKCTRGKCNREFNRLYALKYHILSHFGVRPFKCDFEDCTWAFYSEFKLKRHKETHLKRKDYVCEVEGCGRKFTTIYNLLTHKKLHNRPSKVACNVPGCSEKFQTKRTLELHMRCHDQSHAPYVCHHEGCGKRYFSNNALTSHQRCHSYKEADVKCSWPGCGKLFDKPCRLKAHMRSHTGAKPYLCNFPGCPWAFCSSSKLSRHEKKHTNERKFICEVTTCRKAFLRSEHLKEHSLTHRNTSSRQFQCNLCNSKFSAKCTLYVHIKKNHMQQDVIGIQDPPANELKDGKRVVSNESQGSKSRPVTRARKTMQRWNIMKNVDSTTAQPTAEVQPVADTDLDQIAKSQSPVDPSEVANLTDQPLERRNTARMTIGGSPSRVSYYCPMDACTKSYSTMASFRAHMLRVHSALITDQVKSSKTVFNTLVPNMDYMLYVNPAPQVSMPASQPTDHMVMVAPRDALILGTSQTEQRPPNPGPPPLTSLLKVSQPSYRLPDHRSPESPSKRDQGSARTGLTYNEVLRLKETGSSTMNSVVGATDVVLGAAGLVEGLLLPEELPSVYYQDDIVGTECQVLLLDSAQHEGAINLRDLE